MTIKEFGKKLYKINHYLTVITKNDNPQRIIYLSFHDNCIIYNFETNKYNLANCEKYIPDEMKDVADLINEYKHQNMLDSLDDKISPLTIGQSDNPFKKYTDHLAETLQEKNDAYGDSFTESVDKFGLVVMPIRLSDKFNRICQLIKNGKLSENDESLQDTLLDMAGYSILGLKYLKEHEDEKDTNQMILCKDCRTSKDI